MWTADSFVYARQMECDIGFVEDSVTTVACSEPEIVTIHSHGLPQRRNKLSHTGICDKVQIRDFHRAGLFKIPSASVSTHVFNHP